MGYANEKLTTDEYIKRAKKTHGDRYSYEDTIYTGATNKVTIRCKEHGLFQQCAREHTTGHNCYKCGKASMGKLQQSNTLEFVRKAIAVHGNKYIYTTTKYVKSKQKVDIICTTHGIFSQAPSDHLAGKGCKKCAHQKSRVNVWSYSGWKTGGTTSKKFKGYSLYIIECWNGHEKFIKIGKTYTAVEYRFKNKTLFPYKYKILDQLYGDAIYISKLECTLSSIFKLNKFIPSNPFPGYSECYSISSKNKIRAYIKKEKIHGTANKSNLQSD